MPDSATKYLSHYLLKTLSVLFLTILAAGCGAGGGGGTGSSGTPGGGTTDLSSLIPASLVKYLGIAGKLSAQVAVDGDAPMDLSVDSAATKVAGTFEDIQDGSHQFEVIYYLADGTGKVEVVRGSRTVAVTAGTAVNLEFSPQDLHYTDTDGDGYTNLAELGSGTGWDDINSRPVAELMRSSPSYLFSDSTGSSPEGKSTVVGESSSDSYTLR